MKSMCQEARRNSPSVAVRSPTSACIRTTSAIASSSIPRSSASSISPAACRARASSRFFGRSRLPTWSARNGGPDASVMPAQLGPAAGAAQPVSGDRPARTSSAAVARAASAASGSASSAPLESAPSSSSASERASRSGCCGPGLRREVAQPGEHPLLVDDGALVRAVPGVDLRRGVDEAAAAVAVPAAGRAERVEERPPAGRPGSGPAASAAACSWPDQTPSTFSR